MNLLCKRLSDLEYKMIEGGDVPIEQTIQWGHFQDGLNDRHDLGVFAVFEGDHCLMTAQCTYIQMQYTLSKFRFPFLNYNYIWSKEGPVFYDGISPEMQVQSLELLKEKLRQYVRNRYSQSIAFYRFHSSLPCQSNWYHYQAYIQKTLQINLAASPSEILAQMKNKGRYNIRLARKRNVVCEKYQYIDNAWQAEKLTLENDDHIQRESIPLQSDMMDIFYELMKITGSRDRFGFHPKVYFQKLCQLLSEKASIYMARYEGEYIAAILVTHSGKKTLYYYGASSNRYRNVMAPYLLQWLAILDAKKQGSFVYDFLGISHKAQDNLSGVTRFKKQFGGEEVMMPSVYERSYGSLAYFKVQLLRSIKKMIR